ncbi:MAG: glycosyltransferase family 39 protein [Oscillospiraceae bacterium]|nr:glycosyltransferase family 39 protein [Oscillospiraceae bacterium]
MESTRFKYTNRDVWICLLLAAALALVMIPGLGQDMAWGDDHAAYISLGIALWEGTADEQARLNYVMHPSTLPREADGAIYYIWGYPALLSLVYGAVGFDRTDFHTNIYYKLPSAAALILACAVLYLLYRRRFSSVASAVAALGICGTDHLFSRVDYAPDTDVFFFFLTVLIYLLCELHLEAETTRRQAVWSVCLGLTAWCAFETRLNGVMFVPFILLSQLIWVLRNRKEGRLSWRTLASLFVPWAVFILGWVAARRLGPPVTSNLSDYARISLKTTVHNFAYYGNELSEWFGGGLFRLRGAPDWLYFVLGLPLVLLAGLEFLRRGFGKLLPYTVMVIGVLTGTMILPYRQPVRYLFPILPILVLFVLYGWEDLKGRFSCSNCKKTARRTIAAALLLIYMFFPGISFLRRTSDRQRQETPYSVNAIEMWNYIRNNTFADAKIYFVKPRMLYLNTQRIGICGVNGHSPREAEYFLCCSAYPLTASEEESLEEEFFLMYKNEGYALYQRTPPPEAETWSTVDKKQPFPNGKGCFLHPRWGWLTPEILLKFCLRPLPG